MSDPTTPPQQPNSADEAMSACVQVRSDLKVTRHLRDGEPVYVIQDPISFATHRLPPFQYSILSSIEPGRSLGDNFATMVQRGDYEPGEEELFLSLVSLFRKLSLIVLPTPGAKLFEQSQLIRKHKRRGKILGALFAQIPLVRPDAFLTRTVHLVSWLYTKWFLAVWFVCMTVAMSVIVLRWTDFTGPFNSLLATKNLPFLWLSFVALKVWHELGHGYACKKHGGFVPEMGTILIAGTPAAYVDASSAWSFPRRSQRLTVMCGGMFFESLVFIPSVFVWAFASSPMLASCAYQLVILTSVTTVLFNANPLMKFDGYFILSEVIGIQNLRPRADRQIKKFLSRVTLGVTPQKTGDSFVTRCLLAIYGVSATIYKFFLVIGIATMVAMKFPIVGLVLAAYHIITSVGSSILGTFRYLLVSPETAPIRTRSRMVAACLIVGIPLGLGCIPVPMGVASQGLVSAESEYFLNVDTPGIYENALVSVGTEVATNQPLARLGNERVLEELRIADASLNEARMRQKTAMETGPEAVAWERTLVSELQQSLTEKQQLADSLTINAPQSGKVIWRMPVTNRGMFLAPGTPVARVVAGRTILRTWVNEEQLGSIDLTIGGTVQFRIPGRTTTTHLGTVQAIQPASEDMFQHHAVTQITGGDILLDPQTGQPMEAVFQIDILPEQDVFQSNEFNARVQLMLP
ncbi:MAG: hypothetical protein AB8G99_00910, partial [Planctomycetaceae bacterium]